MSFDKIKAMRNAERFLAQGKIKAAISEYKRVVESDPRDFNTLNMLGDLYVKASETTEAINCFTLVAEHYGKQGFAQKAIAIYNKISRLTPESLEVSTKLAQLYQSKGSVAEARSHYTNLAEQYTRKGKKAEALQMLKQIGDLDRNNTDIFLKIAEAHRAERQPEEAAEAYIEAGKRFAAKKKDESAASAFSRALEIKPNDLQALSGFVESHIKLGFADEAAAALEKVLEKEPYNREIIYLLIDCYLDTNNPAAAEKIVIKLVEQEPANYAKFLSVVDAYIKNNDLEAASRILSMTCEHLLVGGQAAELEKWLSEILTRNPEHLNALRLLVRFHGWQRDEDELRQALERLLEVARSSQSLDDERFALSQLVQLSPHETAYAERLREINEQLGISDAAFEDSLEPDSFPNFEVFGKSENGSGNNSAQAVPTVEYGEIADAEIYSEAGGAVTDFQFAQEPAALPDVIDYVYEPETAYAKENSAEISASQLSRLQQELESVEFYIAQGYADLAVKSLDLLEDEFGKRPEIENFRQALGSAETAANAPAANSFAIVPEPEKTETTQEKSKADSADYNDFRSGLDLEEVEAAEEGDYETLYHLGIAYKEMGLTDDSIREFQDAVRLVRPDDGTRRFLLCCNLLGHCFMEKAMPNLALMWYKRCLETANLTAEEQKGLRYEIANAYEAGNDREKAVEYFEQIYADDVEYRDITTRLAQLREK